MLLYVVAWISYVAALNSSIPDKNQECGGTYNSSVVFLTSLGLPGMYPPGLRCSWSVVNAPSACGLTLDLGDLRLAPCPSDQLMVGGEQLCGDLPRVLHLPAHSPSTNFTFKGNLDGGKGFNITLRQAECDNRVDNRLENRLGNMESFSCGGEFHEDDVTIESPGYPSSYPPEAYCIYTIRRTSEEVCQVDITFENSTLEMSEGCYKDRLEIQGDRLCGELKELRTYGIDDDVLEIRFVTDSEGSGRGFKMLARQRKCADTPIVVEAPEENDKQDVFVDCGPQGASIFPPDSEGYPRFRRPFPPFSLPGEGNRNYYPPKNYQPPDGLHGSPPPQSVPPGSFSQYPQRYPSTFNHFNQYNPGPFTPTALARPHYTPTGVSRPSFTPTDISRPSFTPTDISRPTFIPTDISRPPFQDIHPSPYKPNFPSSFNPGYTPTSFQTSAFPQFSQTQQCCGRIYTDSHFLIVSPGFPRSQTADCIYTIQRYSPLTFQLRFQFRYFWVGQDTGAGCSGGALEIDGERICGCKTGIVYTSQFYDSESVKVLHLRSDSSVDKLFSGFVVEVYQDDSYSRYKRKDTNPSSEEFTLANGRIVNVTQYVETFVQREPLGLQITGNQLGDRTHSQLVWDQNRQMWSSPTDLFCLRWSYQDWILLAKEALWSRYQCPVSASLTSVSAEDSSRFDITACRTCFYFCRQNCQCC